MDTNLNYYINEDNSLTEVFRHEIQQLQKADLAELDMKIKDARPAETDLFGIKRRFCSICRESGKCTGYEANKILFSSGRDEKGNMPEFPTFCKHCMHAAHFHIVEEEKLDFP